MITISRYNSYSELHNAPAGFMHALTRWFGVRLPQGQALGERYGSAFWHEGERYGSLVRGKCIPAGLTPKAVQLAEYYNLPVQVDDLRQPPPEQVPWWFVKDFPWRPYQDDVHSAFIHGDGAQIVVAPPRSGKTRMSARIIDALALPTLVLAPSIAIVRQTHKVFQEIFGEDWVGVLGGGNKRPEDLEKPIVVATYASAVRQSDAWFRTRKALVIDEFHHCASETAHKINAKSAHIYHRIGLTGTHFRTGDDALALEAICSNVTANVDLGMLVARGYLAKPSVQFVEYDSHSIYTDSYMVAYQRGVVENEARNQRIVSLARELVDKGHSTIVLTRRREHADALGDALGELARVVKGGEGALTSRAVKAFCAKDFPVLVGTSVIGEGVDVPAASALIYASGGNGGVSLAQSYFRPLTYSPGKPAGYIYDFVDTCHGMLDRQTESRMAMAEELFGSIE